MRRTSSHIITMTRPEVERMVRDWLDQDLVGNATIKSISFNSAHLAPPQPVMTIVVEEEHEERAA